MIPKLSSEQVAQLEIYAKKWCNIGYLTQPANRSEAERGVKLIYKTIELEPPKTFLWFDSPEAMCIEMKQNYLHDRLGDYVLETLRSELYKSSEAFHSQWIYRYAEHYLEKTMLNRYDGYNVDRLVRSAVSPQVWRIIYPDSILYFALEDYYKDVFGFQRDSPMIDGLEMIIRSAGWWTPHSKACLIAERHNILQFDEQNNPHCEDGFAIAYPDGWGIYAWHGVVVPEYIIMRPQDITLAKIQAEPDKQIADAMRERSESINNDDR